MAHHATSHIHISLTTSNITHSHVTTSHITSRKKRTQRRSSWAEFLGLKKKFLGRVLGPDGAPSQGPSSWAGWLITPHHTSHIHISPHQTSHIHISPYHTSQGPRSWAGWLITPHHTSHIHISPHQTSHIHMLPHHTSQAERREHKEEVLGPSSWAGRRSSWAEFLGRMAHHHKGRVLVSNRFLTRF